MLYKIILCIVIIAISASNAYSLSEEKYNLYMQRDDFRHARLFFDESWNEIKSLLDKKTFEYLNKNHNSWVSTGMDNEVQYLYNTHPFYDDARMYAISITTRALFIKWICDYIKDNKDYEYDDVIDFIKDIDYVKMLNYIAKKLEINNDISIANDNVIYCSYDNYDEIREGLSSAAEFLGIIAEIGSGRAGLASIAAGFASSIDRQEFQCHFRGNVKKYSVAYFYTDSSKKYFEKEVNEIDEEDMLNGFEFSFTTFGADLDFITVRADSEYKGKPVQTLYAFGIDRANKRLEILNPNYILNDVVPQYTFKE